MKLFFLSGPFLHCVELMRPHQVHQIKSNLSTIQLSIGPHETDVSLFVSSVQLGHAAADSLSRSCCAPVLIVVVRTVAAAELSRTHWHRPAGAGCADITA